MISSDLPISLPDEDKYRIHPFCIAIAKSIRELERPLGTTIAVNGPWGSGKSSALNLIRYELAQGQAEDKRLIVKEFRPWWFRGYEAVTLSFLQTIHNVVLQTSGKEAAGRFRKAARGLLNSGPVLGPSLNVVTGGIAGTMFQGTTDALKKLFPEERAEDLYVTVEKSLLASTKRFLIIVDDIDRLDPEESLQVFRLIKSFGRLPNIIYLIAFDRIIAEKTVAQTYPSEGPHFLEKIVQASFDLPLPAQDDLIGHVKDGINALQGPALEKDEILHTMNLFYDWVAPNIAYPRDVSRYLGALQITWGAVKGEVNFGDFMAMEAFRIFWPEVYRLIFQHRSEIVGAVDRSGVRSDSEKINLIQRAKDLVGDRLAGSVETTLRRLFPRLEGSYGSDWLSGWDRERRICSERHFETYFRFSVSEDSVSRAELENLFATASKQEEFASLLRSAATARTRKGTSRIPAILNELNTHASQIPLEDVPSALGTIFSVADDIDLAVDRERGFAVGSTSLRIHWLMRSLMKDRTDLAQRDAIYMSALKGAQVGWACDFTTSALRDYFPREGKDVQTPENCLIEESSLEDAKQITLDKIRAFASDPQASHSHLASILFRWAELSEDGSEVRNWTAEKLKTPEGVGDLAEALTGESWSQTMGGLGDNVAVRSFRASYDGLEEIVDVGEFRSRIESLSQAALQEPMLSQIQNFVEGLKDRDR